MQCHCKMEYTIYRLGDIAEVKISGVDKKTHDEEVPVRLCNFVDVYYNWAITKEMTSKFMAASANNKEIESFTLHRGQVAITKDSETRDDIGIAAYIADDFEETVLLGYHTALITPNEEVVNGKYLNALLHSKYFHDYWFNNATGSGMRYTLSEQCIRNASIYLPSLDEQKKIGNILSSLDRKIALNRKANELLESMAKQLYDYWFVQFDFPNEEGKPYKSSGGKMVYNETLKRDIPEGWEVKQLREYVTSKTNRVSIDETDGAKYAPIEVLPRKQMSFSETAALEKAATGLCTFRKYDILLSNRRVYFHKVCIAPFDGITRDTVFVIRPLEPENLGFCYETLFTDRFIAHATQNSYGTEQPVLPWDAVVNYAIAAPPQALISRYCEKVNTIIQKVIATELETLRLTSLRDYLLPLLMNGQVKVS